MSFKTDTKVLLLHTREIGFVISREEERLYLVDVDGDEIPVFEEDMIVYDPAFDDTLDSVISKSESSEAPQSKNLAENPPNPVKGFDEGILLCFVPFTQAGSLQPSYKILLINDLDSGLKLKVELSFNGQFNFSHRGECDAYSTFYLLDIEADQLNDSPLLVLNLKSQHLPESATSQQLKIKPSGFFKKHRHVALLDESAHTYELFKPKKDKDEAGESTETGSISIDPEMLKMMMTESNVPVSIHSVKEAIPEIDLHIEELVKTPESLSKPQIVEMQMNHFEIFLDRAIANHYSSFRIIHGVGEGKLKNKIHLGLKAHPHVRRFTNHFDAEHGFGGITVVYF